MEPISLSSLMEFFTKLRLPRLVPPANVPMVYLDDPSVPFCKDGSVTIVSDLYPSHRLLLHTPEDDAIMVSFDKSDPSSSLLITTWHHPDSTSMALYAYSQIVKSELLKYM